MQDSLIGVEEICGSYVDFDCLRAKPSHESRRTARASCDAEALFAARIKIAVVAAGNAGSSHCFHLQSYRSVCSGG